MKTSAVTINENAPTLLAKGPCRVRLGGAQGGVVVVVGGNDVTHATGYRASTGVIDEWHLALNERMFALADVGAGTQQVAVLVYGHP